MSSSVSIESSGGLSCYTSKSNSESKLNGGELKYEDYYNGLEAELRSIRTARENRAETRSYTIRRNNLFSRNSTPFYSNPNPTATNPKDGFYDEVDERMSRNSMEYPEQQAKYAHVNRWLDDDGQGQTNNFTSSPDLGNVVGIRGYHLRPSDCGHEEELRKQRANYNKLKFNHLKLASDFDRLRGKFREFIEKSRKLFRQKDDNIDTLKRALREKRKRIKLQADCKAIESKLIEQLKSELASMKVQLIDRDQKLSNAIKGDNDKTSESQLIKEIEMLRRQVKNLSLEPNNRLILELKRENERLKGVTEVDVAEYQSLRENYSNLANRVKVLLSDQKSLEDEKNEEISRLLIELCRYQVQLPKLEMILKTEREIKSEYQSKVLKLEEEKENLLDKLNEFKRELANQKTRNETNQSAELDKLTRELSLWHDKYDRLKREKADSEDLVRSLKLKLTSLDNQKSFREDQLVEAHRGQIERLQGKIKQMGERESTFVVKVDELNEKLRESETLRQQLVLNIQNLSKQLESNVADKNNKQELELQEKQTTALKEVLNKLEFDNRELRYELKMLKGLNDRQKQQLNDVQQRFKTQQKTLEDMKEKKEQEVSKLRSDLNFEKYNRQVALRNMERQMRVGLRELEHVKSQFVQGRRVPVPCNENQTTNGTTSSSCHTTEKTNNTSLPEANN